MARRVFYSFHYKRDNWRAAQVRNAGVLEGNRPASDNDWEAIKKGGDAAIKKWIDDQLVGRSCAVVLIGTETSKRRHVKYEIRQAWNAHKGVLGIYIHNLKDAAGNKATKGANPFTAFTIANGTVNLASLVKAHDPPYSTSTRVYEYIKSRLADWVEEAIAIRAEN